MGLLSRAATFRATALPRRARRIDPYVGWTKRSAAHQAFSKQRLQRTQQLMAVTFKATALPRMKERSEVDEHDKRSKEQGVEKNNSFWFCRFATSSEREG